MSVISSSREAQFRERGAKIVGDGIRDIANPMHQKLDLIEHAVDGAYSPI